MSPLPPAWTGIADYTARLLPYLAEDWELVVFVADDDPAPLPVLEGITVLRAKSWAWHNRLARLDRLLFFLGNSKHHLHVPSLCARHGGVVLAHDVRMTALHCLRAAVDPDRHMLSSIVADRHGPQLASEILAMEALAPVRDSFPTVRGRLEAANALLLAAAVSGADTVLVHSHLAARLARLELHEARIPVEVVPFGHPDPLPVERERSRAVVATFGAVEPEKQPFVLLKALATVRQRIPEATLEFVGSDPDPAFRTRIDHLTARLDIGESVRFAGRVDETTYQQHLRTATVAVQLRGVVNGEASAAVADCLAAGVPTVVTDVGTQAELPPGSVVPVPPGIEGAVLGQLLADLLKDPARRDQLSKAAQTHAAASSFSVAAGALSHALKAAPPPRW